MSPAERAQASGFPPLDDLEAGVRAGDRVMLARAITLIESRHPDHRRAAETLLERLLPFTGGAHRLGLTGVPGVGKSTFIEAFGCHLIEAGHRVMVLAIDPSSRLTGGSILGDKTRMSRLANAPEAFVRPSPSGGRLGGVAQATREAMLLGEAAGFDIVIVETVGAGQSETLVAEMVDCFLLLLLPGAGDELQGIKKGVMELADILIVNKADQDPERARRSARDAAHALRIFTPADAAWKPPVLTVSAIRGEGMDKVAQAVAEHRRAMEKADLFERRRREQRLRWMWTALEDRLHEALKADVRVKDRFAELREAVEDGRITPAHAARELLAAFGIG